ncbi:MAG TPA: DinB family protein [Pyrinomonadaceae bacterium]|nr:DinB family protein [Pyrinomonadaceae bacterium]
MEEAWLSGPIENISPLLMPAAHSLVQAAVDIERNADCLTTEELWTKPNGAPSVGFHLLHIAGSIDRLLTYCRDKTLNEKQFAELAEETKVNDSVDAETLARNALEKVGETIRVIGSTSEESLFEKRAVGRKRLPTNVFGLLFHIAEHTQRHVGQIVATAKIVKIKKAS